MFVGAVPKAAVEQIVSVVDFSAWGTVWVGCSGSFRFDRAVKQHHPSCRVISNDVSLWSCALGALCTGTTFPLTFKDRLAFIEDAIGAGASFGERVAAVLVAQEMARYAGKSDHARAHFQHYADNWQTFFDKACERISNFVNETPLDGYEAGDFRDQTARAIEHGGGIAAFPPTYKGGYERIYKLLGENVTWPEPEYGLWNPDDLPEWLAEVDQAGLRYCVIADHEIEGFTPITAYRNPGFKEVLCYASDGRASVRRTGNKATPFAYRPAEASALTAASRVQVIRAPSDYMNFLKDKYLKKGIAHATGDMNFMVLVDGMLVGGFIYSKSKYGDIRSIYLLSDFSISRERKLSKLVAMMAASADAVRCFERRFVVRIEALYTTAFTNNPVSMKYRGIWELHSRKPGFLQYRSEVRHASPQEIYDEWFRRFAGA